VITGWDFVGDAFTGSNTPVPDPYPDDCNGHGSHVAGIVGADGAVVGVAPDVTFGAYRVFGCDGSTTSDIMLAAMEMAYNDGMHVLNMSIGSRAQWPQYPTAAASSRLVKRGMVVVASIGNNGPGGSAPDGPYAAGAPVVRQRPTVVRGERHALWLQPGDRVSGGPDQWQPRDVEDRHAGDSG
jgi:subtilisin family serine protease